MYNKQNKKTNLTIIWGHYIRPISNVPFIPKIIEKVTLIQLQSYLAKFSAWNFNLVFKAIQVKLHF